MEMYFGACERISYCIENGNQEVEGEGCEDNACKYSTHMIYIPSVYCSFQDESLPEKWPQYGNIEFRLVSLKHANQSDCFIRDLSINIPAGQRVSINLPHQFTLNALHNAIHRWICVLCKCEKFIASSTIGYILLFILSKLNSFELISLFAKFKAKNLDNFNCIKFNFIRLIASYSALIYLFVLCCITLEI